MYYLPSSEKLTTLGFESITNQNDTFFRESRRGEIWDEQTIKINFQDITISSDTYISSEGGKFTFRIRSEAEFDILLWQIGYSDNIAQSHWSLDISNEILYTPTENKLISLDFIKSNSSTNQFKQLWIRRSDNRLITFSIGLDFDSHIILEAIDESPPDFDHAKHSRNVFHTVEAMINNKDHTKYMDGYFRFKVESEVAFDLICWQLNWTQFAPPLTHAIRL